MEYEFTNRPAFAELAMALDEGERIRTEATSLVSYSDGVAVTPDDGGGLEESLEQSVRSKDTAFSTMVTADRPGTVTLAPPFPGDISHYELRDEKLYVQSCSFLAAEPSIEFGADFSDSETFVDSDCDFLLELSGNGLAFLTSYGAISVVSLDPGEQYVVDTGHVVAFEDTIEFTIRRVEGVRSPSDTGRGLFCEFEGPGTIWTQSRSPAAFLAWLVSNLPSEDEN
ncbi:TIGR00266 family protein [Haladaptatus sp. NG-SE-30]